MMAIWIATTGNRDVQLNQEKKERWQEDEVKTILDKLKCTKFKESLSYTNKQTGHFALPSRVLGTVYGKINAPMRYRSDLVLPLFDTFVEYFDERDDIEIDRVIVLLTDQAALFDEERKQASCPFWQDTCALKPILDWYFEEELLGCDRDFIILRPEPAADGSSKGCDRWETMLDLVKEKLEQKFSELGIDRDTEVYISHQAGTPAISSAVQFTCLGRFNKVQFLLSNPKYDRKEGRWQFEREVIESSRYWRGLQVEKVKKLLLDGIPGAALNLWLEDEVRIDDGTEAKLKQYVTLFSGEEGGKRKEEFQWQRAGERIRRTLDVVEFLLRQGNYLAAMVRLATAQETFLRAAIVKPIDRVKIGDLSASQFIIWNERGLCFPSLKKIGIDATKNNWGANLAGVLSFPLPKPNGDSDFEDFSHYLRGDRDFILSNFRLLEWLKQSIGETSWTWPLLDSACSPHFDLRDRIARNLCGVGRGDAIAYLEVRATTIANYEARETESEDDLDEVNIASIYEKNLKKPFVKILRDLGLHKTKNSTNFLEKELEELAETIH